MDGTLVSARMSSAKKEAGAAILSSMGATASDLINAAYDYVLATKELPSAIGHERERRRGFESFVSASTIAVDWRDDAPDGDYKSLMRDRRAREYESLA